MCELAPSILSANFNCLGEQIKIIEKENVKTLHIDVMDGIFVPSISFGMPLISSIRKESNLFFDVHLMVQDPERYIKEFVESGADSITIHVEACNKIEKTFEMMESYHVKKGISINPETSIEEIKPYLAMVDVVLVMSVHPGFGGQKLIQETLNKVEELKKIRQECNLCYTIEVDGGITQENVERIVEKGADIVVAGTAVFKGDISENIKKFRGKMNNAS